MALRRIDVETLLMPPAPPKASIVMLGMSVRTLANWRSTGKGPPYLKIGVEPPEGHQDRRKVRYQRAVAERWASAHEYRRTVAR